MPRVLHVLDETTDWAQRVAIGQLVARLGQEAFSQEVVSLAAGPQALPAGVAPLRLPAPLGMAALAAPALHRHLRKHAVDLVHAWGPTAAAAARAALPAGIPLVTTVVDPGLPAREVGLLREVASPGGFAVACASARVRQRLVEQGLPLDQAVLLRPAVDFAAVNAARNSGLRAELGVPEDALLIVAGDPPGAADGLYAVLWSAHMRWYLDERVRVILPPTTPRTRQLRRFSERSATPQVALFAEPGRPFEQYCAIGNVLALAETGEIPTTSIAWAMAASTAVIAPATYSTSELVTHDVNGLLYKAPPDRRRRGALLCSMYDRLPGTTRLREAARGQAYEVFSLRRFIQQQRQLYENLLQGRTPGEHIDDPAALAARVGAP